MNPFQLPERLTRLQIEVTTGCNLKCPGCQRTIGLEEGTWRNQHMKVETFRTVLANCPPSDVLVLQGIGEPTLHPDLPELLQIAKANGRFKLLSFNTNALVREPRFYKEMRQFGLAHVSVSVDGLTQEIADRTRTGTDVDQLRSNLSEIVVSGLGLTVSIVLSRWNLMGFAGLLGELAGLGVRVIEVQPLIGYVDSGIEAMLDAADINYAIRVVEAARRDNPQLHIMLAPAMTPNGAKCRRPLHAGYITVKGLITPCCVTNDVDLFGKTSLVTQNFATAWNQDSVAKWMQTFFDGEPEICRNCSFNPSGSYARAATGSAGRPAADADAEARRQSAERHLSQGRLDDAERELRQTLGPEQAEALHNLGMTQHLKGQSAQALSLLEAAAALSTNPRFHNNLAAVLSSQGRADDARRVLEATVQRSPEYPQAYLTLGELYNKAGRAPEAAATFGALADRAAKANNLQFARAAIEGMLALPEFPPQLLSIAHQMRLMGDHLTAVKIMDRARQRHPDNVGVALAAAIARLPVIYESAAQTAATRAAYGADLERLVAMVKQAPAEELVRGATQGGRAKPFYLSYAGESDRDLQSLYGTAVAALMRAAYPHHAKVAARPSRQHLRVGFATGYWHLHSVSKLFGSWPKELDRKRFEVFGYNLGPSPMDEFAQSVAKGCDHFVAAAPPGGDATAAWAGAIAADELDALIYPEIGMEDHAVRLAALRLAPVQAMAWGHPITSGLDSVDYFLSSDLMEPANGAEHYTEKLVRLPGLSICYRPLPPDRGGLTRAGLGLPEKLPLFLCCQSLFKYRPADDAVLVQLAGAVPDAQFVFIGQAGAPVTQLFRARLDAAFTAAGQSPSRIRLIPPVPGDQFQSLLGLADVYLDSLAWSGGNTTLEAVTAGVPIVTLPGPLMRGRHSAAILRYLGLDDFITDTPASYVALAAKLATDASFRTAAAARVRDAAPRLFGDLEPVRALENFLIKAARG